MCSSVYVCRCIPQRLLVIYIYVYMYMYMNTYVSEYLGGHLLLVTKHGRLNESLHLHCKLLLHLLQIRLLRRDQKLERCSILLQRLLTRLEQIM